MLSKLILPWYGQSKHEQSDGSVSRGHEKIEEFFEKSGRISDRSVDCGSDDQQKQEQDPRNALNPKEFNGFLKALFSKVCLELNPVSLQSEETEPGENCKKQVNTAVEAQFQDIGGGPRISFRIFLFLFIMFIVLIFLGFEPGVIGQREAEADVKEVEKVVISG